MRVYIDSYISDPALYEADAQVSVYLSIYHLVIILFHKVVLKPLIDIALEISQLKTFIDRDAPSVIT